MPKLSAIQSIFTVLAPVVSAIASPPIGLTQLDTQPDRSAKLAVIGGVAYASRPDGVQPVDAAGVQPTIGLSHPTLGDLQSTSRVVEAAAGGVYVVGDFDRPAGQSFPGSAVFRLDQPSTPLVTWEIDFALRTVGLDENLRAVANGIGFPEPIELLPDGTSDILSPTAFSVADIEPGGLAIGDAVIPNTIGSAPVLFSPGSDVPDFLGFNGFSGSIEDRIDGNGVNIGFTEAFETVIYGNGDTVQIDESIGAVGREGRPLVSGSDFVVIDIRFPSNNHLVYFPGVNPAGADRSVPLLDFFPDLQALAFDTVTDISSHGGQIHLLLSGDDGLWLYAAPDPTVIPEPTTLLLAAAMGLGAPRRR